MEKKFKKVPFNIELAKKIQSGEVEGKIKQLHGEEVEILCWDLDNPSGTKLAVKHIYYDECCDDCGIHVDEYTERGEYWNMSNNMAHNDLFLEVPDNGQTKHEFKPFDRVLVRNDEDEVDGADWWVISLFMDEGPAGYRVINGKWYDQCIPYEGNEYLAGKRDNPKED